MKKGANLSKAEWNLVPCRVPSAQLARHRCIPHLPTPRCYKLLLAIPYHTILYRTVPYFAGVGWNINLERMVHLRQYRLDWACYLFLALTALHLKVFNKIVVMHFSSTLLELIATKWVFVRSKRALHATQLCKCPSISKLHGRVCNLLYLFQEREHLQFWQIFFFTFTFVGSIHFHPKQPYWVSDPLFRTSAGGCRPVQFCKHIAVLCSTLGEHFHSKKNFIQEKRLIFCKFLP